MVIVGLVLTLAYTKWPKGGGRYQMTSAGAKVFILDTNTGKIWVQYFENDDWHVYKSPSYGK